MVSMLSDEILTQAIRLEIEARDFYAGLSGRIKNRRGRKKMLALSRSEEGHRKLLSRRYRSLYGKTVTVEPSVTVSSQLTEDSRIIDDGATALQVISLGIDMEERAVKLYTNQLEAANDDKERRLLQHLLRFERKHRAKLQGEYLKLDKSFYWTS